MRGAWTPRYATSDTPQTTARAAAKRPHTILPTLPACSLALTTFDCTYLLGAYYYYNVQPDRGPKGGPTYEQTILDVARYARAEHIPYRYWLADSWWYSKGAETRGVPRPGVSRWEALPAIFPRGLGAIARETNWSLMAHNRYWSASTPYAVQNGGQWRFELDSKSGFALPLGREFWDSLFGRARSQGWQLSVYEQDWMNFQHERLPLLTQSATAGGAWLRQMGAAALDAGVSVQYCMSFVRHVLQSVEIDAVTQARGSWGYRACNPMHEAATPCTRLQPHVHVRGCNPMHEAATPCPCARLQPHVLGARQRRLPRRQRAVAPSRPHLSAALLTRPRRIQGQLLEHCGAARQQVGRRDGRASRRAAGGGGDALARAGDAIGHNDTATLNLALALTQPPPPNPNPHPDQVMPSDAIGHSDAALLRRCAMVDGTLLHPASPAVLIDAAVLALAQVA